MAPARRTIQCVEGEAFSLEPALLPGTRRAELRLRMRLQPRLGGIVVDRNGVTVRGIIGSIDIGTGTVLSVTPKTEPGEDWIRAVLGLLVGHDRIDAAGERAAGLSPDRRSLLDVL